VVVIVCGVSGAGKTTVGKLLAQKLGWQFYDADNFHSAANVEKMKNGIPLTDEDRQPWLETLRQRIQQCLDESENCILACSALKRAYRDHLRVNEEVKLVFLRASRARISEHLQQRRGHFMNPALLDSQFKDLEEPKPGEDICVVDIEGTVGDVAELIQTKLRLHG
jgi:gluconokinase